MNSAQFYKKLHEFRLKHLPSRTYMLLLSLVVGIFAGFAAIMLKNAVFYGHHFLTGLTKGDGFNLKYILLPFIGIFLTYIFVRYIIKDNLSHGISRILQAISKNNSIIKLHNTYSSLIASTITVSFGGSVGLEAPVAYTGSAIGSNIGRFLRLDYKSTTLLLGCGSAAAIAGIFKAPIAAVIFSLEVLMLDLTMASLLPLLIASVTGATIGYFFMGQGFLFEFNITHPAFRMANLPFYALLGVFAGFVSLYFTKANLSIESSFQKIPAGFLRVLTGGAIVSLLIFLFPPLFGEGYSTLHDLLIGKGSSLLNGGFYFPLSQNNILLIIFLGLILIFKVVAMSATTAGGGVGGIFAPSLFMGGVSGFFFARIINSFWDGRLPETNFTLAGMAGVMAGVMHAPLTAIFLIAEITGGYQFFVPLIITSVFAYITIMPFEPHSLYTKRLAVMGELITHHKDKAVLSRLSIEKLIETNFLTVNPEATLGEFVKIVAQSQRNVFPVVDKDNFFLGVVFINDIRNIIFEPDLYDSVFISSLMFMPDVTVTRNASMEDVAKKFAESSNYNIPVLEDGKYVGFVSRANVFSAYRKLVKEFSEE
jgi:chloride channel protein, CIC family